MDLGDFLLLTSAITLIVEVAALVFLYRFRRRTQGHKGDHLAFVLQRTIALLVVAAIFRLGGAVAANLNHDPPVVNGQFAILFLGIGPIFITLAVVWAIWDLNHL